MRFHVRHLRAFALWYTQTHIWLPHDLLVSRRFLVYRNTDQIHQVLLFLKFLLQGVGAGRVSADAGRQP